MSQMSNSNTNCVCQRELLQVSRESIRSGVKDCPFSSSRATVVYIEPKRSLTYGLFTTSPCFVEMVGTRFRKSILVSESLPHGKKAMIAYSGGVSSR
jgi:hypothetical protein